MRKSTLRQRNFKCESSAIEQRRAMQMLGADRLVGNWFYFLQHRQAAGPSGQLGDSRSQPATQQQPPPKTGENKH